MKLLFLFLLCLLHTQVNGQYYELKNPSPYLGKIKEVEMATAQHVFLNTENSEGLPGEAGYKIRKSTNNGESFTTVYSTELIIRAMDFVDALTGWIVLFDPPTSNSIILRTSDGGVTWENLMTFSFPLFDIAFYNMGSGLVSGRNGTEPVVYISTNGGDTWTEDEALTGQFNENLIRVGFSQANQYYAVSTSNFYLRQAAGWFATDLISTYGDFLADAVWTERGCVIMMRNGRGFAKMSGINSNDFFNMIIPSTSVSRFAVNKANALFMYALGGDDSLLTSTDMGGSWNYSGKHFKLNDMSFNAFNAFMVLGERVLSRSTNFGQDWASINGSFDTFADVVFPTPEFGITAGTGGTILTTTNGGETWSRKVFENQRVFTKISAPDKDNIFILNKGAAPSLLKSINGGGSWTELPLPSGLLPQSIYFKNSSTGFIAGSAGKLYFTTSGGNSWSQLNSGTVYMLTSISFLNDSIGWIGSANGVIISTDGGATWNAPSGSKPWFFEVQPVTPITGYGITLAGTLMKTTNAGVTWDTVAQRVTDIYTSGSKLFALQNDALLYSNNGGSSFVKVSPENLPSPLYAFAPIRRNLFSVISQQGLILSLHTSSANNLILAEMESAPGLSVSVPVYIDIPEGRNFVSSEFVISGYDTNMTFIGLDTSGTIAGSGNWLTSVNPAGNKIRFAASGTNLVSSSGVLIKLRFTVSPYASGVIPLNFNSALIDNGFYATDTVNGFVRLLRPNYGDVDLNNIVQAFDASLVLRYVASLIGLNTQQRLNANVTADTEITAFDASVILRFITGLIPTLPYSGTEIAAGDAAMTDQQNIPGSVIEIPIRLNNGGNLYSYDGVFAFDETYLEFISVQWQTALSGFAKETHRSGSRIYIAGAATEALTPGSDEILAKLIFRIKPGAALTTTQVVLKKLRLNENPVVVNAASSVISITTGLENETGIPVQYSLGQNYPNPFNPSTTISFALPHEGRAVIELYDIMGERIAVLLDESRQAGYHYITLNASELSGLTSSVYFYRLRSGAFTDTKKLILLK